MKSLPLLDRLDAQLLTLHVLERPLGDRAWLIAQGFDRPEGLARLPQAVRERLDALAERRLRGEPVAYLVGEKEFFGLSFQVNEAVLVPRPETEVAVECALQAILGLQGAQMLDASPVQVLDLGTGSGAIAVSLAWALHQNNGQRRGLGSLAARVCASDLSEAALAVARANAARHGVNIEFRQGAWFEPWAGERFDVIVSNPPYVPAGDPHLAALQHEPTVALVGAGADGLSDLRTIVGQATAHLKPGGWLMLEHGHDQAAVVRQAMAAAGLQDVGSRRDLAGIERVTAARHLDRHQL